MGVTYSFYAEIKVKDKWYSLNPIIKDVMGNAKSRPILEGRSWLHDAVDELYESRRSVGVPEDASEEVLSHFHTPLDDEYGNMWGKVTYRQYYQSSVYELSYLDHIASRIKKDRPYKFRGYVRKRAIANFEVGEIEEISNWLTPEEYEKTSAKEKKYYAWYEWNEPDDEYGVFYALYSRVESLCEWFWQFGFPYESGLSQYDISRGDIRIIVQTS